MDSRVELAKTYVACGPLPGANAIIDGLLAYAEERLKVNVGLLSENTALKKAVQTGPVLDLSSVSRDDLLAEIKRRLL